MGKQKKKNKPIGNNANPAPLGKKNFKHKRQSKVKQKDILAQVAKNNDSYSKGELTIPTKSNKALPVKTSEKSKTSKKQKQSMKPPKEAAVPAKVQQNETPIVGQKKQKSLKKPSMEGDDISAAMRNELEVFIKNLDKDGYLINGFVVDDDSKETEDDDDEVVSFDGDYEEFDEEAILAEAEKSKQEIKDEDELQSQEISSTVEDHNVATSATTKKSKKEKKKQSTDQPTNPSTSFATAEKVTSDDPHRPNYLFLKETHTERSYCLLRPKDGEPWHKILEAKLDLDHEEDVVETNQYWVTKLEKFASKLLDGDVSCFNNQVATTSKKSSEKRFIETVLRSGTLNDKISAYVVMIQESPVHHLATLQTLIDMVSLKSRRPCMLALDALQNLFANTLLIPNRKLREFAQSPLRLLERLSGGNRDTRDKYLILWIFEQNLKSMYQKFLAALAEVGQDTNEGTRRKVMTVTLELLCSNPEQEQELLSRLINKLGDPVRAVAAKAVYQIGLLLERHPAMRSVVLSEIERLLYRTNISKRAQYYGICCLTQLVLADGEEENTKMANKLITIYFGFFKATIKKGDIDSKLVTALLTGVHRAFPFAAIDNKVMDNQVNAMYKLAALSNINVAIHAFMLLFQVMGSGGETVTDRFYTAVYKKLMCPEVSNTSKPALLLNLIYKIIKNDPAPNRVLAFIKRILQLSSNWPPQLACSTHYLISEVLKNRPEVSLAHKVDENVPEIVGAEVGDDDDDEADDYRKDVPLPDEDANEPEEDDDEEDEKPEIKPSTSGGSGGSSWVHRKLQKFHSRTSYDVHERNPLFAGAEKTNMWELPTLTEHYHPTAALFAQNILEGNQIKYSGDALSDFTLMHFLDRFVFRNPKKDPGRNKPHNVFSKRNTYQPPPGVKSLAPDSKEYIDRDENQVPLDERFIYRYFREKKLFVADEQDSDADSVASDEAMEALELFSERPDDEVDFASAVEQTNQAKGKKRKSDEDEDGDLDDSDADSLLESDDDLDEEVGSDEGDVLEESGDDDFEEVEDFEDLEDDDFEVRPKTKAGKAKASGKSKLEVKAAQKRKMLKSSADIFAAADEFSELIDEDTGKDFAAGGHSQVSNKDKSSAKQLNWESGRHSDFKNRFGSGGKKKFNKTHKKPGGGRKVGGAGGKFAAKKKR